MRYSHNYKINEKFGEIIGDRLELSIHASSDRNTANPLADE